jgi:hypothetical protein
MLPILWSTTNGRVCKALFAQRDRLDDKLGSSSVPGCGVNSQAIRGSLADRRAGVKKGFCCVTTLGLNLWVLNGLGRELDTLTAFLLCLGMPGFDAVVLAAFGLPPRRLPAADLS